MTNETTFAGQTLSKDYAAHTSKLLRIENLIHEVAPSSHGTLVCGSRNTYEILIDTFVGVCGFNRDDAPALIEAMLMALEAAMRRTDWRKGYGKTYDDATIPEVAASLCIAAIRLTSEPFSARGMVAYKNRHREFVEAMADFADHAAGSEEAHGSFYTSLGKAVAQRVLEHKLTGNRPAFTPLVSEYKAIECAALEQLVYFIQAGDTGPVKIGIARDPNGRLASLQTGHHETLAIRAITIGGSVAEATYHRQFSNHRLRGEWFAPHPDILAEIDRLKEADRAIALRAGEVGK